MRLSLGHHQALTGLDTNVLVRYLMQDDAAQSALATRCIESLRPDAPGFVSSIALVELNWVLATAYRLSREQVAQACEALLSAREIIVQDAETAWRALRLFRSSTADLADCLIERGGVAAGCEHTVTFDRGAARDCGMILLTDFRSLA